MIKNTWLALPFTLMTAGAVQALPIIGTNGFGLPVIPGTATTINFDAQANGSFASLTLDGITFSGIGGNLRFDGSFANNYNGRGTRYMDNNSGGTVGIRFDFSSPLNAFAFNWGASDIQWTLTAYDAFNNVIETLTTPVTSSSNAGDYIGMANAGMAYITLTASGIGDWVFIDNFTFAAQAVPEPGSLAVLGLGLAGLAGWRRRKQA